MYAGQGAGRVPFPFRRIARATMRGWHSVVGIKRRLRKHSADAAEASARAQAGGKRSEKARRHVTWRTTDHPLVLIIEDDAPLTREEGSKRLQSSTLTGFYLQVFTCCAESVVPSEFLTWNCFNSDVIELVFYYYCLFAFAGLKSRQKQTPMCKYMRMKAQLVRTYKQHAG